MPVQSPTPGNSNRAFDLAVNAAGLIAIVLLAGALVANYFPVVPSQVVLGVRWAGFACIVLYAAGSLWQNRDWLVELFGRRNTRTGANALVLTVAVVAILVLVNYMGTRYHSRLDLTRNKQFSLAPQTTQILRNLKQELKITAFVQANDPRGKQLRDLAQEYSQHSDKIKLNLVDTDRNPEKVQAFIQGHPTLNVRLNNLLIEHEGRFTEAQNVNEQDITNAILKATATKEQKLYFLQGHGEFSPAAGEGASLSMAKDQLEKQNYKVEELNLFGSKGEVPADATAVIIAGAKKPVSPEDLAALKRYQARGGKLLLLLAAGKPTGIESLLTPYGVEADPKVVYDLRYRARQSEFIPAISQWGSHPITTGLQPALMQLPRPLELATSSPAGVSVVSLGSTSDESYKVAFDDVIKQNINPGRDARGPFKVAVAITMEASGSAKANRMVVVGNADFAANPFMQAPVGNSAFFVNLVNWVADQDALVAIPARTQDQNMTEMNGQQQNIMFFTSVLGAPGLLLLAGVLIWWRRRRS